MQKFEIEKTNNNIAVTIVFMFLLINWKQVNVNSSYVL